MPASLQVDLSGQVAVVTGGSSGIGRATAIRLAQSGARVTIGDLSPPENDQELTALGIQSMACDVRDVKQLQRLIDGTADAAGRLDILINNAGVVLVRQTQDVVEAEWDRCLDTNLKGAFFAAHYAIPHFLRAGRGCIVNTASNAGLLPRAHDPVYSISKMALVGLTKSLALTHSRQGIRVNCVCPGPVDRTSIMETDLQTQPDPDAAAKRYIQASPLAGAAGRMIHPEEVADAILYLCSEAAAMVTGTAIAIDGGKSLGVPPAHSSH